MMERGLSQPQDSSIVRALMGNSALRNNDVFVKRSDCKTDSVGNTTIHRDISHSELEGIDHDDVILTNYDIITVQSDDSDGGCGSGESIYLSDDEDRGKDVSHSQSKAKDFPLDLSGRATVEYGPSRKLQETDILGLENKHKVANEPEKESSSEKTNERILDEDHHTSDPSSVPSPTKNVANGESPHMTPIGRMAYSSQTEDDVDPTLPRVDKKDPIANEFHSKRQNPDDARSVQVPHVAVAEIEAQQNMASGAIPCSPVAIQAQTVTHGPPSGPIIPQYQTQTRFYPQANGVPSAVKMHSFNSNKFAQPSTESQHGTHNDHFPTARNNYMVNTSARHPMSAGVDIATLPNSNMGSHGFSAIGQPYSAHVRQANIIGEQSRIAVSSVQGFATGQQHSAIAGQANAPIEQSRIAVSSAQGLAMGQQHSAIVAQANIPREQLRIAVSLAQDLAMGQQHTAIAVQANVPREQPRIAVSSAQGFAMGQQHSAIAGQANVASEQLRIAARSAQGLAMGQHNSVFVGQANVPSRIAVSSTQGFAMGQPHPAIAGQANAPREHSRIAIGSAQGLAMGQQHSAIVAQANIPREQSRIAASSAQSLAIGQHNSVFVDQANVPSRIAVGSAQGLAMGQQHSAHVSQSHILREQSKVTGFPAQASEAIPVAVSGTAQHWLTPNPSTVISDAALPYAGLMARKTIYICKQCHISTELPHIMTDHVKQNHFHHYSGFLVCKECLDIIKSWEDFIKHVNIAHREADTMKYVPQKIIEFLLQEFVLVQDVSTLRSGLKTGYGSPNNDDSNLVHQAQRRKMANMYREHIASKQLEATQKISRCRQEAQTFATPLGDRSVSCGANVTAPHAPGPGPSLQVSHSSGRGEARIPAVSGIGHNGNAQKQQGRDEQTSSGSDNKIPIINTMGSLVDIIQVIGQQHPTAATQIQCQRRRRSGPGSLWAGSPLARNRTEPHRRLSSAPDIVQPTDQSVHNHDAVVTSSNIKNALLSTGDSESGKRNATDACHKDQTLACGEKHDFMISQLVDAANKDKAQTKPPASTVRTADRLESGPGPDIPGIIRHGEYASQGQVRKNNDPSSRRLDANDAPVSKNIPQVGESRDGPTRIDINASSVPMVVQSRWKHADAGGGTCSGLQEVQPSVPVLECNQQAAHKGDGPHIVGKTASENKCPMPASQRQTDVNSSTNARSNAGASLEGQFVEHNPTGAPDSTLLKMLGNGLKDNHDIYSKKRESIYMDSQASRSDDILTFHEGFQMRMPANPPRTQKNVGESEEGKNIVQDVVEALLNMGQKSIRPEESEPSALPEPTKDDQKSNAVAKCQPPNADEGHSEKWKTGCEQQRPCISDAAAAAASVLLSFKACNVSDITDKPSVPNNSITECINQVAAGVTTENHSRLESDQTRVNAGSVEWTTQDGGGVNNILPSYGQQTKKKGKPKRTVANSKIQKREHQSDGQSTNADCELIHCHEIPAKGNVETNKKRDGSNSPTAFTGADNAKRVKATSKRKNRSPKNKIRHRRKATALEGNNPLSDLDLPVLLDLPPSPCRQHDSLSALQSPTYQFHSDARLSARNGDGEMKGQEKTPYQLRILQPSASDYAPNVLKSASEFVKTNVRKVVHKMNYCFNDRVPKQTRKRKQVGVADDVNKQLLVRSNVVRRRKRGIFGRLNVEYIEKKYSVKCRKIEDTSENNVKHKPCDPSNVRIPLKLKKEEGDENKDSELSKTNSTGNDEFGGPGERKRRKVDVETESNSALCYPYLSSSPAEMFEKTAQSSKPYETSEATKTWTGSDSDGQFADDDLPDLVSMDHAVITLNEKSRYVSDDMISNTSCAETLNVTDPNVSVLQQLLTQNDEPIKSYRLATEQILGNALLSDDNDVINQIDTRDEQNGTTGTNTSPVDMATALGINAEMENQDPVETNTLVCKGVYLEARDMGTSNNHVTHTATNEEGNEAPDVEDGGSRPGSPVITKEELANEVDDDLDQGMSCVFNDPGSPPVLNMFDDSGEQGQCHSPVLELAPNIVNEGIAFSVPNSEDKTTEDITNSEDKIMEGSTKSEDQTIEDLTDPTELRLRITSIESLATPDLYDHRENPREEQDTVESTSTDVLFSPLVGSDGPETTGTEGKEALLATVTSHGCAAVKMADFQGHSGEALEPNVSTKSCGSSNSVIIKQERADLYSEPLSRNEEHEAWARESLATNTTSEEETDDRKLGLNQADSKNSYLSRSEEFKLNNVADGAGIAYTSCSNGDNGVQASGTELDPTHGKAVIKSELLGPVADFRPDRHVSSTEIALAVDPNQTQSTNDENYLSDYITDSSVFQCRNKPGCSPKSMVNLSMDASTDGWSAIQWYNKFPRLNQLSVRLTRLPVATLQHYRANTDHKKDASCKPAAKKHNTDGVQNTHVKARMSLIPHVKLSAKHVKRVNTTSGAHKIKLESATRCNDDRHEKVSISKGKGLDRKSMIVSPMKIAKTQGHYHVTIGNDEQELGMPNDERRPIARPLSNCNDAARSSPDNNNSRRVNGSTIRYECLFCVFSGPDKERVYDHIKRVHINVEPYSCPKCSKKSWSYCKLEKHILQVHKDISAIVSIDRKFEERQKQMANLGCTYTDAFTLEKLKSRLEKIHRISKYLKDKVDLADLAEYECAVCHDKMTTRVSLRKHLYSHTRGQEPSSELYIRLLTVDTQSSSPGGAKETREECKPGQPPSISKEVQSQDSVSRNEKQEADSSTGGRSLGETPVKGQGPVKVQSVVSTCQLSPVRKQGPPSKSRCAWDFLEGVSGKTLK